MKKNTPLRFTGLRLMAYLIRALGVLFLLLGLCLSIYFSVLAVMVEIEERQNPSPSLEETLQEEVSGELVTFDDADLADLYLSLYWGTIITWIFSVFATGIALYAAGALIFVFLAIEENTRITNEYLYQLGTRQNRSAVQESFQPYKAP